MNELRNPAIGDVVEWKSHCKACGSVAFKVEEPKGPHGNHLRCHGCNRGGLWMRKNSRVVLRILECE